MPKADALAEAKAWLRGLTASTIDGELTRLHRGKSIKRRPVATPASTRRYEHPSFWASFILIGDPD